MIQKFEVWLDVRVPIPDNAIEQFNMVRNILQEIGFVPVSEKSPQGGCKLTGVNRVGQQLRATLENERGCTSSGRHEPLLVTSETVLALFYPGLRVDPVKLKRGFPVDLRVLPVEPHSVEDLRYYFKELLDERAAQRRARGQDDDVRCANVLARGMHGVERRVGGALGPIAMGKP